MQEVRFLSLAVSRRASGNCIAGIDIDTGQWLRPIHSQIRAAFADSELIVVDNHTGKNRFMAPLDLLAVPIEAYAGTNSQPENRVVAPRFLECPQPVLRTCKGRRTAGLLVSHVDHNDLLLHSPGDAVQAVDHADCMLSHSLSLVRPLDLAWMVSAHPKYAGKVQVRAEFRFGMNSYRLVVTDPVWEERCHRAGIGRHQHAELSSPGNDLVFLTVSLAAMAFHGQHFKIVAGVVELPKFDFTP
jgi:hypothetical protein